jgi:hypothetical protein
MTMNSERIPRVSVVAWAGASTRMNGLQSVLMQETAEDFEVLVSSSSNVTLRGITDDRVRTGGRSIAEALRLARGRYVSVCHLDDLWIDSSKLASQSDALDANDETCFSCHRAVEVFADGLVPARDSPSADREWLDATDLLPNWSLAPRSSMMVRRNALEKLPSWCFEHPFIAIPVILLGQGGTAHWDERRFVLLRTRREDARQRAACLDWQISFYRSLAQQLRSHFLDALGDGCTKLAVLDAIEKTIPPGEGPILVVTGGDPQLLDVGYREAVHFPGETCGAHPGALPEDGRTAVELLEVARDRGAAALAIPATSLWWLHAYAELADYLDGEAALLGLVDNTAIYSLAG